MTLKGDLPLISYEEEEGIFVEFERTEGEEEKEQEEEDGARYSRPSLLFIEFIRRANRSQAFPICENTKTNSMHCSGASSFFSSCLSDFFSFSIIIFTRERLEVIRLNISSS